MTFPVVEPAVAVTCATPFAFVTALAAESVAGPDTENATVILATDPPFTATCTASGVPKAWPTTVLCASPETLVRLERVTGGMTVAVKLATLDPSLADVAL